MHLISASDLFGKGFGGHADIVFSKKQGFMRYPEVDEIVMGSPQTDSEYMYIIHSICGQNCFVLFELISAAQRK